MSRFYHSDGLVIDLEKVSLVYGELVVVDGYQIKLNRAVAFDIRKQFVLYKENRDKCDFESRANFGHNLKIIAWASNMLGSRLFQIARAREQKAVGVVQ